MISPDDFIMFPLDSHKSEKLREILNSFSTMIGGDTPYFVNGPDYVHQLSELFYALALQIVDLREQLEKLKNKVK